MVPPLQSYFVRVRGDRVVVENLGNHEWVELTDLDEVGPQIQRDRSDSAPGADSE
jgi:hypothetical protein